MGRGRRLDWTDGVCVCICVWSKCLTESWDLQQFTVDAIWGNWVQLGGVSRRCLGHGLGASTKKLARDAQTHPTDAGTEATGP